MCPQCLLTEWAPLEPLFSFRMHPVLTNDGSYQLDYCTE